MCPIWPVRGKAAATERWPAEWLGDGALYGYRWDGEMQLKLVKIPLNIEKSV